MHTALASQAPSYKKDTFSYILLWESCGKVVFIGFYEKYMVLEIHIIEI